MISHFDDNNLNVNFERCHHRRARASRAVLLRRHEPIELRQLRHHGRWLHGVLLAKGQGHAEVGAAAGPERRHIVLHQLKTEMLKSEISRPSATAVLIITQTPVLMTLF